MRHWQQWSARPNNSRSRFLIGRAAFSQSIDAQAMAPCGAGILPCLHRVRGGSSRSSWRKSTTAPARYAPARPMAAALAFIFAVGPVKLLLRITFSRLLMANLNQNQLNILYSFKINNLKYL
ncbi:hypothetical protein ACFOFO_20640 [Undibacterium arcticum]|uniref:Uncharacterized protein n=1 Tax=Undibacterium arcticum TaxID=1762892 RepID=A0ABV7F9J6_9BURK